MLLLDFGVLITEVPITDSLLTTVTALPLQPSE